MSGMSKSEVEQMLLDECKEKGFKPGSLFLAKTDFWLPRVPGQIDSVSIEPEDLVNLVQRNGYVIQEDIWMFIGVHPVMNHGSWDLWFEFLSKDETIYVNAYVFLPRVSTYFLIKNGD